MKVLYISDPGSVGGAARALLEVVRQMKRMGVEPIVCTSVLDAFNHELTDCGIENFACGHLSAMNTRSPYRWKRPIKFPYEWALYKMSLPKAIECIERSIDIETVDLIHTNSARNDIGCILAEKYRIPHIMHIREFGQEDFDCICYRPDYYEYLNRHCDFFLAISNAVRNSWIAKGIHPEQIRTLYDGVDIKNITQKKEYPDSGILKMVIAGGVCEPKGQHIAVKALSQIPQTIRENFRLDIVGWEDPRYVSHLKQFIKDNGLQDIVNFLGSRDDLYDFLHVYDVGLMCSKSEGFGRVTAEYLYVGLGVLASDTGACPELVKNGKTGMIYPYGDAETLAECMVRYYNDRALLRTYGENAKTDALRFSADRNAKEIMDVYHELLGGRFSG